MRRVCPFPCRPPCWSPTGGRKAGVMMLSRPICVLSPAALAFDAGRAVQICSELLGAARRQGLMYSPGYLATILSHLKAFACERMKTLIIRSASPLHGSRSSISWEKEEGRIEKPFESWDESTSCGHVSFRGE